MRGGGGIKSGCRIQGGRKKLQSQGGPQKAVVFLWRKASLTRASNYRNSNSFGEDRGGGPPKTPIEISVRSNLLLSTHILSAALALD
jgi:hypothetical protein